MFVGLIGSVVVGSLMEDHSDEAVLSGGFGVLDGLEPKLVVDIAHEEDVIKELILDFYF